VSDPHTLLTTPSLNARWLGRVTYADGLALQEELVSRKVADSSEPDHLLLLEHEPVYTIGRTPDQTSLREASALPHPVHVINRGGQATYHGPGQLVGYPILDLRRRGQDLHVYLRAIEDFLLNVCASFSVEAQRREGLTGIWVGERKLASIGVGVRRWISMHGFALNVTDESLSAFSHITPCGIGGVQMTSLQREAASEASLNRSAGPRAAISQSNVQPSISVIAVAERVAELFTQIPALAG
jgi:lipoyl(octanoyl) transferase